MLGRMKRARQVDSATDRRARPVLAEVVSVATCKPAKWTRTLSWIGLSILLLAWSVKGLSVVTRETGLAAQALYFTELAMQRAAAPIAAPPTVESIATEVHRRAVRQLFWVGSGLALCWLGIRRVRYRIAAVMASSALFLAGWMLFEDYVHLGLILGLDLKLRLVQGDVSRLGEFVMLDAILPALVALTGMASLLAAASSLRE
jgi:hypothetical protein